MEASGVLEKGGTHRVSFRDSVDLNRSVQWMKVAAQAASEKKGEDTVILEVGPLLGITDGFVITSGTNDRQVKTIADEVEAAIKAAGGPSPVSVEGLADAQWILIDYGMFVVHVFNAEAREFYDLDRLWGDASVIDWEDDAVAVND